jgi:hypothetical protein
MFYLDTALGTMQNILKARAGGKSKFYGKKPPALCSIKRKNVLPRYLTLGKNVDALLLYYNFLTRFIINY